MKLSRSLLFAAVVLSFTSSESSADKQRKLIAVLTSGAPPGEKAITCKQLAIYGDKEAVPALAPLLSDSDLASWARIALEAIPGPEADAALRSALPNLQGNLLIGAINSIGVRRDGRAVDALARKLGDSDAEVAIAAAVALGKIGGTHAGTALGQTLANAREQILSGVAEGCILCAERFLEEGKLTEATALYDAVRNKAGLPPQKRLEATRGAILARGSAGLPLLLEQLRSPNNAAVGMALRTARELKGRELTDAIGEELDRASADRQVSLLLAISDRKDDAVLPKLLQVAGKGSKPARVAALGLLDRFGEPSAVPILLTAAAGDDNEIAEPAKATLTRMEGKTVDEELLRRLPQASGKTRQVMIELAALRRIEAALPAVLSSVEHSDPGIRRAAISTLSALGSAQHSKDLAGLLSKTDDPNAREEIEDALLAVCARHGAKCLPHVLPLAKNQESELRIAGLRALATIGGADAAGAVAGALGDSDEAVQDEAVGLLATWPNNWPDETSVAGPLLSLARSGQKPAHKIQGVRGYLLHLQENKKLSNSDKLSALDRLLPVLQRPSEKRLAIATLSTIPTGVTLELLSGYSQDPVLSEEAFLAIVNVATAKNLENASPEVRKKALQTVVEKSGNESTREKASGALRALE